MHATNRAKAADSNEGGHTVVDEAGVKNINQLFVERLKIFESASFGAALVEGTGDGMVRGSADYANYVNYGNERVVGGRS